MKRELVYLSVEILHPHPNNPRKDLGDLTELAESVKESGVMQNLTVVPHVDIEGEYTVIIGHRRLGASKLAGLSVVPCVIVEMSEKEQLATMMLENMQRSDLTFYEQAEGFQMMIDLGETVESISEKTGLSKSTVRNRVKLAKYDRQIMREAAIRQPTMEQYMKLCEIEDVSRANDVARFLGTRNFDREVDRALSDQKEKKEREKLKALVETVATRFEGDVHKAVSEKKVTCIDHIYTPVSADVEKKVAKLKSLGIPLYFSEGYGFAIFRDCTAEDDDKTTEEALNRAKRQELERKADDLYKQIEERADAFVKEYRSKKSDMETLSAHLFEAVVWGKIKPSYKMITTAMALGWVMPDGGTSWDEGTRQEAEDYILDMYDTDRARTMLVCIYHMFEKQKPYNLFYHDTKLTKQTKCGWMFIFSLLTDLGYNVSDEEWAFINGSHPLYNEEVPR